jgi:hypothetical protein
VLRISSELDDKLGHPDSLDDVKGSLAVSVSEVDVASRLNEEAEDVGVTPRSGGVDWGVRVFVEGVGRDACVEWEREVSGER